MREEDVILFSKVEFHECLWMYQGETPAWGDEKIIFLDIVNHELSVQIICTGQDLSNKIYLAENGWRLGCPNEEVKQIIDLKVGKNGIHKVQAYANDTSSKVIYSKGVKLSDQKMKELLPLCNALAFEPFRNREMSMNDAGYKGYRDEYTLWFKGITDSYLPKIELPMDYIYDEKHTWPNERLYQYLRNNYLKNFKW